MGDNSIDVLVIISEICVGPQRSTDHLCAGVFAILAVRGAGPQGPRGLALVVSFVRSESWVDPKATQATRVQYWNLCPNPKPIP